MDHAQELRVVHFIVDFVFDEQLRELLLGDARLVEEVHAYRLIMPGVLVTQLHDDVEHFSVQQVQR